MKPTLFVASFLPVLTMSAKIPPKVIIGPPGGLPVTKLQKFKAFDTGNEALDNILQAFHGNVNACEPSRPQYCKFGFCCGPNAMSCCPAECCPEADYCGGKDGRCYKTIY